MSRNVRIKMKKIIIITPHKEIELGPPVTKLATKNFVEFRNHSPLSTMVFAPGNLCNSVLTMDDRKAVFGLVLC